MDPEPKPGCPEPEEDPRRRDDDVATQRVLAHGSVFARPSAFAGAAAGKRDTPTTAAQQPPEYARRVGSRTHRAVADPRCPQIPPLHVRPCGRGRPRRRCQLATGGSERGIARCSDRGARPVGSPAARRLPPRPPWRGLGPAHCFALSPVPLLDPVFRGSGGRCVCAGPTRAVPLFAAHPSRPPLRVGALGRSHRHQLHPDGSGLEPGPSPRHSQWPAPLPRATHRARAYRGGAALGAMRATVPPLVSLSSAGPFPHKRRPGSRRRETRHQRDRVGVPPPQPRLPRPSGPHRGAPLSATPLRAPCAAVRGARCRRWGRSLPPAVHRSAPRGRAAQRSGGLSLSLRPPVALRPPWATACPPRAG